MIVPVHKGRGRDPLIFNNYWGITLTFVPWKCLKLILERLEFLFLEKGFPHHLKPHIYKSRLSCTEAIFLAFLCTFDRATPCISAFSISDSVEYPTLLSHIFRSGINGKCWKDWYTDTSSVVEVNNKCSDSFPVTRVKQGLILSPTLYCSDEVSPEFSWELWMEAKSGWEFRPYWWWRRCQHKCDCSTNTRKSHQCIMQSKLLQAKCKQNRGHHVHQGEERWMYPWNGWSGSPNPDRCKTSWGLVVLWLIPCEVRCVHKARR